MRACRTRLTLDRVSSLDRRSVAVYVDNMRAAYGRLVMCHMVADTLDELHRMADVIGIDRRHYQGPPRSRYPHYDIGLSKKALALKAGAVQITMREAPAIARRCLAGEGEVAHG